MAKLVREVGIKQLKDEASSIVEQVARTRRPVTICRGKHRVARVVPYQTDDLEELLRSTGMVSKPSSESWSTLDLTGKPHRMSSSVVDALLREREEE